MADRNAFPTHPCVLPAEPSIGPGNEIDLDHLRDAERERIERLLLDGSKSGEALPFDRATMEQEALERLATRNGDA
jgi:hypothetical protein